MRPFLLASLVVAALQVVAPRGVTAGAIIDLELVDSISPEATFNVFLTFEGNPGDLIDAVQLSILGSDDLMTLTGTDFSRFRFEIDAATLPGWTASPELSEAGILILFPDDPIGGPFLAPSPSRYQLGQILIDLAGLDPAVTYLVSLTGPPGLGTDASGLIGGVVVSSFGDDPSVGITFNQPEGVPFSPVPEPGSLLLLGLGAGLLAARGRWLSRERSRSGSI